MPEWGGRHSAMQQLLFRRGHAPQHRSFVWCCTSGARDRRLDRAEEIARLQGILEALPTTEEEDAALLQGEPYVPACQFGIAHQWLPPKQPWGNPAACALLLFLQGTSARWEGMLQPSCSSGSCGSGR